MMTAARVQSVLAAGRKQHNDRDPIPDSLRHDIVQVARACHASPVAQEIRPNDNAFQRRVLAYPLPQDDRQLTLKL